MDSDLSSLFAWDYFTYLPSLPWTMNKYRISNTLPSKGRFTEKAQFKTENKYFNNNEKIVFE